MSKRHRVGKAQVVREPRDRERELTGKPLTEREIHDKLPQCWKDRGEAGRRQIAIPIPGSVHHS